MYWLHQAPLYARPSRCQGRRRRIRTSTFPYLEREPRDVPLWLARVIGYTVLFGGFMAALMFVLLVQG